MKAGDLMHRLIYRSRPGFPVRAGWLTGPLQSIARAGLAHNTQLGLTGVLCIERNAFLQVLEGEPAAVEQTFGTVRKDARHYNVEQVSFEPVEARAFTDWAVAFALRARLPATEPEAPDIFAMDAPALLRRAVVVRSTGLIGESGMAQDQV